MLPYRDLFDHKGPYVFWINSLGYMILKTHVGVCLIQIFYLIITTLFSYVTFRSCCSRSKSFVFTFLLLCNLLIFYEGGNTVEEFLSPFLMISVVSQYKWADKYVNDNIVEHRSLYAFIYGFTFSLCVLSSMIHAIGLCFGIVFISIILVLNREWNCLLRNVVFFLLGFLIPLAPFSLYFYLKGIFNEMWFAMITFNLNYAGSSGFEFGNDMRLNVFYVFPMINTMCLFIVGLYLIIQRRLKLIGTLFIFLSVPVMIWILNSNAFSHYSIISLGYFILILLVSSKYKMTFFNRMILYSFIVLTFSCATYRSYRIFNKRSLYVQRERILDSAFKRIFDVIPQDEKKQIVLYNCDCSYYLKFNFMPCYRFFMGQDMHSSFNESYKKKMLVTFNKGYARYIVVFNESGKERINNILKKKYNMVKKEGALGQYFTLYHLK